MRQSPSMMSLSIVPSQFNVPLSKKPAPHPIPPMISVLLKKAQQTINSLIPRFLLNKSINTFLNLISSRSSEEEEGARLIEALVRSFLTFVPEERSAEDIEVPSFETFYNETLRLVGRSGAPKLREMAELFYQEVCAMAQQEGCSMNDVVLDATALHIDRQFLEGDTLNSLNMVFKELSRQLLLTTSLSFTEEDDSLTLHTYTQRFKAHRLTSLPHAQACALFFHIATLDFDFFREATPVLNPSAQPTRRSLQHFVRESLGKLKKVMIWNSLFLYDYILSLLEPPQPSRRRTTPSHYDFQALNQRALSLFYQEGIPSLRRVLAQSSLAHKLKPYMEASLLVDLSRFATPIRHSLNQTFIIFLGKGLALVWNTSWSAFSIIGERSYFLARKLSHRVKSIRASPSSHIVQYFVNPGETFNQVMKWVMVGVDKKQSSLHFRSLMRYAEQGKVKTELNKRGAISQYKREEENKEEEGVRQQSKSV